MKASKLRRLLARGKEVADADRLWFDEYEASTARAERARVTSAARTQSKEQRRVRIEVDEAKESQAEAIGPHAAMLVEREAGRRIDALAIGAVSALKEACDVYKDVCLTLKENFEILSDSVVESMQSQRAHYLAAGELQLQLQQAQTNGNPAEEMLMMVFAKHFGLGPEEMQGVRAAAAAAQAQQQQQPKPNGAAKR